jgi:hypothetical protein
VQVTVVRLPLEGEEKKTVISLLQRQRDVRLSGIAVVEGGLEGWIRNLKQVHICSMVYKVAKLKSPSIDPRIYRNFQGIKPERLVHSGESNL